MNRGDSMQFLTESEQSIFNLEEIKEGWCAYVKHTSWTDGKAGFISALSENTMIVQYSPGIRNISNHTLIKVKDVVAGEWEIRVSPDLKNIYEYKDLVDEI